MSPTNYSRAHGLVASLLLVCCGLLPRQAGAYPWMVQHGYTSCAECHTDPSGGGILTAYGRAQAEILVPTDYGRHPSDWEPGTEKDFLFGAVTLPSALALQIDERSLAIPEPGNFRWIQMQTDLRALLKLGKVLAYADLGYANEGAWGARITSNPNHNLLSRHHWLGVDLGNGLLLRAGRLDLPFGLRSEGHYLQPRTQTRTNTNADQQHGLALSWSKGPWRSEAMGIAGNYQLSPDDFRERGASLYVARRLSSHTEIGLSGLATHAKLDVEDLQELIRQAYGAFGRYAPVGSLALMGEADLLLDTNPGAAARPGLTGYLQADAELLQGLHVIATGTWCDDDLQDGSNGIPTAWLAGQWFLLPRVDLRVDGLRGTLGCSSGATAQWMGLAQVHFFL